MIPVVFVAGLLAGLTKVRWWIVPVGAVYWLAVGLLDGWSLSGLIGGGLVAALNAATGVAISRGLVRLVALVWRQMKA